MELSLPDRIYDFTLGKCTGETLLTFIEKENIRANLKMLMEMKQDIHDSSDHDLVGLSEVFAWVNVKMDKLEKELGE